ncbi:cysteine-rich venom protein 1-like [Anopheles funestus]|uniref:TIL domain-containing protein n=1 Tax=Anopheles funestus TaxID=62324 RepID=A0A4Y0BTH8_ANOFN|nr:cysteine-rich venom protein 1-like [Anopheles funestus]
MKTVVFCCIALFAAIIGCSDAQETNYALEHNFTTEGNNESQQQLRCTPTKQCDVDEEFNCCGPCYQLSCYDTAIDCGDQCFAECYCVEGFVREYPGGRCIPKLFCQKPTLPILSDNDESL